MLLVARQRSKQLQKSFSDLDYTAKKRKARRDRFLEEIDAITPWAALVSAVEPHYPKGGGRGRPAIGLERMLRMYIAQQCFGLVSIHPPSSLGVKSVMGSW